VRLGLVIAPVRPGKRADPRDAEPAVAGEHTAVAGSTPARATGGRVLLVVHNAEAGGAERMALAEAAHLAEDFELLISVPHGPLHDAFAAHGELVRGFATLPLWGGSPRRWIGRSGRPLIDAVRMARLVRDRRIELVLTNSSVCLAPVARRAPAVFAIQGALAQTVIVIAAGLTPYFRRGRRARVVQIADGIVMDAPVRAAVDFHSPLRLCLVGGVDRRKGQDVAVAALALLRERGLDATLALVGRETDSDFADRVREDVERLGLERSVEFVGEVPNAGPQLARADIVIAPSRGEWTPLVLMEALASEIPVVATRVGGVEDVVTHRESGLLIDPEDPSALAAAIAELAADPHAAVAMAARGREHVERGFKIERTLERLSVELVNLL
jgi:glycosyltransferase involved in cell wall biosynthesis